MFGFFESAIHDRGFRGVAFLMALEKVFPLILSKVVMPLAGVEATIGARSPGAWPVASPARQRARAIGCRLGARPGANGQIVWRGGAALCADRARLPVLGDSSAGLGFAHGSQSEAVTQWIGRAVDAVIAGAITLCRIRPA